MARLTGGRRARSPRYLEIFSSSSSISGLGEIDQIRTLPAPSTHNHLPIPTLWLLCLPLTPGKSTPCPLQGKSLPGTQELPATYKMTIGMRNRSKGAWRLSAGACRAQVHTGEGLES